MWDACRFCTGNRGLFAWSCRRRVFRSRWFSVRAVGRTGPKGGRGYPPLDPAQGWGGDPHLSGKDRRGVIPLPPVCVPEVLGMVQVPGRVRWFFRPVQSGREIIPNYKKKLFYEATVTVPRMNGWMVQRYGYVPVWLNVNWNVSPWWSTGELSTSGDGATDVTV
jgi:hypothetical protein